MQDLCSAHTPGPNNLLARPAAQHPERSIAKLSWQRVHTQQLVSVRHCGPMAAHLAGAGPAARRSAAAASSASSEPPIPAPHSIEDAPATHKGHAFLHDFCMAIPYGMLMVLLGLASLLFGAGRGGAAVAGGGAALLVATTMSLIQWRAYKSSKVFTLLQAVVAGLLSWTFWSRVEQGGRARWPSLLLFGVSGAMVAFLVYNIFAGGNPPKRTTEQDDRELAAAAARS